MRGVLATQFGALVRFYVWAALFLPPGAVLGAWLATGPGEPWASRAVIAHVLLNVVGWIGLTVLATVLTLFAAMLRTKLPPGAVVLAQRTLPVSAGATALAAAGTLAGLRPLVVVLLLVVSLSVGAVLLSMAQLAWQKPPASYGSWATLCAMAWLAVALIALVTAVAGSDSWPQTATRLGWLVPPFTIGLVAQVLTAALSYLLPVVLRGGPRVTRAMNYEFDRGLGWRLVVLNLGVLLFSLPVPSLVKVAGSMLGLVGLASSLPLAARAVLISRRA
ncbi:MAG: hypothetical protein ACK5MR_10670 [Cumulibacter sp.]